MQAAGVETSTLTSQVMAADAKTAVTDYPGVSGNPLLESLRTPVANVTEAQAFALHGGQPPGLGPQRHLFLSVLGFANSAAIWGLNAARNAVNGWTDLIVESTAAGQAYLWIQRPFYG